MQLAAIADPSGSGGRVAVAVDPRRGVARLTDLATPLPASVRDAIAALDPVRFNQVVAATADESFRAAELVKFVVPIHDPPKVWGIGLNYRAHADDLGADYPDEPASFLKASHTMIGHGDDIPLPAQSRRVTAEAEVGLVIGKYCRNVSPDDALDYVWGVIPILDQTAEDILQRNPRFLTRAKNFPGFFSCGPTVVAMPDVLAAAGSLAAVEVATVRNGSTHRVNRVANMIFSPAELVSFHSAMMPLYPGDIISSGTPGAVVIQDADVVECRITGLPTLTNPVRAGAGG